MMTTLVISQVNVETQQYVIHLKETGTVTCKPENTPMDLNLRLINWGSSPIDSGMYQYLMRRLV